MSCHHTTWPFALLRENSSFRLPVAKIRSPAMRGVACGPAPSEKSRPVVGEGYRCSQIVVPAFASSAAITSSRLRRAVAGSPSGRYIVYSRPPSTTIDECPSPSVRLQSFFGPLAGHLEASPFESDMKLRLGPPHWGQ